MTNKTTIQRILKVNHAGEYGAIRIYRAQLLLAKVFYKELTSFLKRTLSHEVNHCQKFLDTMPPYDAKPCRLVWLWSLGGFGLGLLTALLGKNAIMICTQAVEKTVHEHLEDQINFLDNKDNKLKNLIEEIQAEEIEHLEYAEKNLRKSIFYKPLYKIIAVSTQIVIWLSTQGDVTKMKKEI